MSRFTFALTSLLLALSTSLTACTRESTTKSKHEGSKTESADSHLHLRESLDGNASLTDSRDKGTLLGIWQKRLATESMDNELRNGTAKDRESFYKLSQDVLAEVQAIKPEVNGQADEIRAAYLAAFTKAILGGCDQDLGGCRYIRLFRQNPTTIPMIIEVVKQAPAIQSEADLRNHYQLLRLAHVYLNQRENSELTRHFLASAAEYELLLQKSRDPNDQKRLDSHREIIDQLLLDLSSTTKTPVLDPQVVQVLADKFGIWKFDRPRTQTNSTRDRVLLQLTARRLFEGNELQNRLAEIAASPEALGRKLAPTILSRPKIGESVGLTTDVPKTLTTFLLESLWMKKLTIEEARVFWEKSLEGKSDAERLALVQTMKRDLLNYSRNRLFVTAQDVNKILIDFFQSSGRFSTADAFQEALKESVRGQVMWADATNRFETLNTFHDQNFRGYDNTDQTTKDLTFFFAGIDRNIKLTSTYPSMLVMCYHLARLKFSLRIMTWFGVFKIEAGKILEWFFNGELAPWLPYGTDKRPISKSEMLLVFHYAAELGVLEGGGVNIATLFQMMNEQMLGTLREDVSKINRAFRTKFETASRVTEFRQICEEQKRRNAAGSKVYASTRMPIEHLEHYALMGFPQGGGGNLFLDETFFEAWTFWETEREITMMRLDDNLETLRLELSPKIEMFELYRDIAKAHLERHMVSSRQASLNAINAQIQPLKELRKETYSRIFRIHNSISDCSENLLRGEIDSQAHVIRGLMAHFRLVHRAMAERRKTGAAGVGREFAFNNKFDIDGLAQHERLLGYSQDSYRMSRVQALLLVTDILQNGYRDGGRFVGPIRDKNSIIIPDRVQNFNQSLREKELNMPWRESESEFIDHGIQLVFNHRDHVLSWADRANRQMAFIMRMESLVALAKAGPQETSEGVQQFKVQDLLKSHLTMLKALEGDEMMAYVLNTTARFRLPYLEQVMNDYAWTKGSREWLGLFDYLYEMLAADRLGDLVSDDNQQRRGLSRIGPQLEFSLHRSAMRSLGEPALRIPSDTMDMLNNFYSRRIDTQLSYLTQVLKESKRLEALRAERPQNFPSWRLYTNRPAPKVPILGTSPVDRADGELREMAKAYGYKIPAEYEQAVKSH